MSIETVSMMTKYQLVFTKMENLLV